MKKKMPKVLDENSYRFRLLEEAKFKGCYQEMQQLFIKFDNLLRNSRDPVEREHIGKLGVFEVSKLLDNGNVGAGGTVTVNGEVIISGDK